MPRLKVFRTTNGIDDYVVAVTSRPAALKMWGARTDLFSMGVATEVTDPKVRKKALENPGEVIRIGRAGKASKVSNTRRKTTKARKLKPDRKKLDAAERKLEQLIAEQQAEIAAFDREMRRLQRKQEQLARRHDKARLAAEEKTEAARAEYQAALEKWTPGQ